MQEPDADAEELFREEARRRAARIEALTRRGVPARGSEARRELWRHAHSLKGTAGSLGHEKLEELAERVAAPLGPDAPRETPPDLEASIVQLKHELAEIGRP